MQKLVTALLLCALTGCQTTAPNPAPAEGNSGRYPALAARAAAGEMVSVAELREAFLADPAFPGQLSRLTELENQALQLATDEPLKLGSLGSAILDIYQGSLAGHFALQRFYEHVENLDTAAVHRDWVERIRSDIDRTGNGSLEAPYLAVSPLEPVAYARSQGLVPVGSIYRTSEEAPFVLLLQARPGDGPLSSTHFNLQSVYEAVRSELERSDHSAGDGEARRIDEFNPFALMIYLARQGDTAAQAAIGAYQATHDRPKDAIEWLRSASRSGNVLANNLLARVFFELAEQADSDEARAEAMEQVMENYLHAVALGSLDSAYALGVLYVNEHYGPDNVSSGLPLLRQAAESGHTGANVYLGHLSYQGRQVEQSYALAGSYYLKAAETDNAGAQKTYARFALDRRHSESAHPQTMAWMTALAKEQDDPEAMVLLGNLHARGLGGAQNFRRARRWFDRAVKASEQDPNIVNEVVWVLTVSHLPDLKREAYALSLMTELMERDTQARQRPEYLDTWAASYAANGQFERAISIQQQALEKAEEANDPAVIEELKDHLRQFEAGETLTEQAP